MNYITTSRKPCDRVKSFVKDLAFLFSAQYITRGKNSISDLIADARYKGVNKIIIITEKNGNPFQILTLNVNEKTWDWSETYFITILKTRSEITSEKPKFRAFDLKTENKELIFLLKSVNAKYSSEANAKVKDKGKGVSIYYDKKEIGPAFKVEWARDKSEE